ncbi:transposase domain-containing protein [Lutibacter sp. B2]|nr:transposase domain-containing protein [Lutibacter sp. B2]
MKYDVFIAALVRGANSSSIIYSIVETAKEQGLNPMNYITYLFEQIPNMDLKNNPELLKSLLPWGVLPKKCYLTKKD